MALYKYKVSDKSGQVSEMLIEGDSQADATRRLQRRGVLPLEFLGEGMSASTKKKLSFKKQLDVVDFSERLVPLLEAKIPLERALGIVSEGMGETPGAKIINDLRRGLHEGRRFSDLIRDRESIFPPLFANVVEAGEEAGALPEVMTELHRFLEQSREFKSKLISSSVYPIFIMGFSGLMLAVIFAFVIPRFGKILNSLGGNMPPSTQLLLSTSELINSYGWVLLFIPFIFIFLVLKIRQGGALRDHFDNFTLSLPIVGQIVLLSNLARLSRTMAVLMRSGVHLLDTVKISTKILQNNTLRQSISSLASELRRGQKLSSSLSHSKYMPTFMLRMIGVGEETGDVENMLDKVAARFEKEVDKTVQKILTMFEPCMIILLGIIIGFIVITMFSTVMEIQSQV